MIMGCKRNLRSHVNKLNWYDYTHTNWFCFVQENIKVEVLKVQTKRARSVH